MVSCNFSVSLFSRPFFFIDSDRIAEYDMKLMDIDAETLGIPDTDYDVRITMPSNEFSRIVRDLSLLGESVKIEVSKEGVRFISEGEAANGNILLKQSESIGKVSGSSKKEEANEDDDDDDEGDEENEEEDSGKKKSKKSKAKVKKEDGDVEMDDDDENEGSKKASDDEGEEEVDEDEDSSKKKRKRAPAKVSRPLR